MTLPFLQRLHIKPFMVVYLSVVLLLGVAGTGQVRPFLNAVVILVLYVVADLLWTKLRDNQTYLPLSSFISGLIGSIVLAPASPWWVVVAFPLIAVAGKQLLHLKGKHLFNPAAFSLLVLSLFFPTAISWWGVAWWGTLLKVVGILVGLLILTRIRRFPVTLPFLFVYAVGLGLTLLTRGSSWQAIGALLFDGTLIFFASVMLVEPVTTSYRTKRIQVFYGAGVGLLAVLAPFSGLPLPDGFLPPLLVGNLLAALTSIRRRTRSPSPTAPQPVTSVSPSRTKEANDVSS